MAQGSLGQLILSWLLPRILDLWFSWVDFWIWTQKIVAVHFFHGLKLDWFLTCWQGLLFWADCGSSMSLLDPIIYIVLILFSFLRLILLRNDWMLSIPITDLLPYLIALNLAIRLIDIRSPLVVRWPACFFACYFEVRLLVMFWWRSATSRVYSPALGFSGLDRPAPIRQGIDWFKSCCFIEVLLIFTFQLLDPPFELLNLGVKGIQIDFLAEDLPNSDVVDIVVQFELLILKLHHV